MTEWSLSEKFARNMKIMGRLQVTSVVMILLGILLPHGASDSGKNFMQKYVKMKWLKINLLKVEAPSSLKKLNFEANCYLSRY